MEPELRVSHETIYQSLYVQGRGALRAELHQALRSGRAIRRPQARSAVRRTSRIPDMVLISERPAEVEDRAVPGHWEGDLIVGSKASSIGTLVERHTRFVMLLKLREPDCRRGSSSNDHPDQDVARRAAALGDLGPGKRDGPASRVHDCTGVQVYFCDPHSPWQLWSI